MPIVTILLIVFFPLNILLSFNLSPDSSEEKLVLNSEQVQGTETINNVETKEDQIFPSSSVVPKKKPEAINLVIPTAHSSIILDANSGTVLMNTDADERRQIASLTKMMTAIMVMEKVKNLDEDVAVDEDAVYVDGTRVGCPRSGYCISQRLKVGEKISARNLLKAMLMNSANDAAVALGKHIGGTEDQFVEMMNDKAEEMRLENTHFCTASGLEKEGLESECYSSAYDVAKIAAYAMRYDLIWDIMKLPNNTKITSSDGQCAHDILNTDIVVNEIPNCIGGKTGFTPLAGRSLMIAAADPSGKNKIIAVLLDDPYRWQDIKTMISWAFQSYEWK